MRDNILLYAIGISVALHLAAVGVIGRTSASKLNASTATAPVQRLVNVDFVGDPDEAVKKPRPVPVEKPQPEKVIPPIKTQPDITAPSNIHNTFVPPNSNWIKPPRTNNSSRPGKGNRVAGNPGGKLNVGSVSNNGDLGGNWNGGKTPVGHVPGSDRGTGIGSGNGPGVSRPDPDNNASDGPGTTPAPPPPPPPPPTPKMVSVRVCNESGMIPGDHCKHSHSESFIDGKEPSRACNQCKAPEHKSRLADQEKPLRIRDWNVSLPSSVEDGSFTVVVGYTVTEAGNVTGVKVIKSSGNRAVDRAVVNAAPDMKYKPAIQDGVPRSVYMTRECTFK